MEGKILFIVLLIKLKVVCILVVIKVSSEEIFLCSSLLLEFGVIAVGLQFSGKMYDFIPTTELLQLVMIE